VGCNNDVRDLNECPSCICAFHACVGGIGKRTYSTHIKTKLLTVIVGWAAKFHPPGSKRWGVCGGSRWWYLLRPCDGVGALASGHARRCVRVIKRVSKAQNWGEKRNKAHHFEPTQKA